MYCTIDLWQEMFGESIVLRNAIDNCLQEDVICNLNEMFITNVIDCVK